jgi:hypothetical protein
MSGAGCTCSQRPTDLASDALNEYACRRDGGESEIVAQMVDGEITSDEAGVAASVIETKRKALETEEMDRRLSAVEERIGKKG